MEDMKKKLSLMTKTKWKGNSIDVRTMYESADEILQFESAMKLIALVAIIILFFIILIGVLNTLRMTIRERTREIGTVRAIGMHKRDVMRLFITETLLLTIISCLCGIVLAFITMGIISLFSFETESILSIILVDRKIYFLPEASSIIINFILILFMAGLTAFFPAKRASKLSSVEALRHYK
jgi:ABC-type antimicrobial peptide transport system permease subunit